MDSLVLEAVRTATDDVRDLIGELDRTLSIDYLPEQRHGLPLDAIFRSNVRFFIARQSGIAAGCGGVSFFANFAEVKRMYVRQGARGRGIAQALLARIEQETLSCGLDVLRLETGDRQLAALRLYERAGFLPCDVFGAYASLAPQAIASSVFMEKRLGADAKGRS